MQTLSQHRVLSTTLFLGMLVALLMKPMSLLLKHMSVGVPVFRPVATRAIHRVVPVAKVQKHPVAKAKAKAAKVFASKPQWSLSPMTRQYLYSFSGMTLCEGTPCAATIKVTFEADGAGSVPLMVQSDSQGRFRFQAPFLALPSQQLDWHVRAVSDNLLSGEIHGRQILPEQQTRELFRNIELK